MLPESDAVAPAAKESNMVVETSLLLADLQCCDFLPEDRDQRLRFQFYCPVCLRYFNRILASACCRNYLCLLCVEDIRSQERKNPQFIAHCPYACEVSQQSRLPLYRESSR